MDLRAQGWRARKWVAMLVLAASAAAAAPGVERAAQLYRGGEYTAALNILEALPEKDGSVYLLIGQCQYMAGDAKAASAFFEKAVDADPRNAEYHHWLGRAYGRRAETSNLLLAPRFAVKARQSFERSVGLDPHNLEAVNDLFEYYLEAPGLLGGGVDKAAALAVHIGRLSPVEYHYAQARLAEKRKQFQVAERHYRRAVEMAPRDPGRLIDLAKFLAQRGRHQESDEIFRQAREIAPEAPHVWFAQAKTYVECRRNLDTAKTLLRRYLTSRLTPGDPPRSEAEKLLKQLSSAS